MDRNQAKQLLPIIQAFAEGKTIQQTDGYDWYDLDDPDFMANGNSYRIKPESKYRPFVNAEECWQEMQKHQPFGWIKGKEGEHHSLNTSIIADEEEVYINGFDEIMEHYTFADGLPFGVKVEE
jgi:hypothetical protein